ncbi:type IV toxin-antitoxin system AbiEi family antitoxin domain-containing protein [Aquipuribacter sp. SD81]|uniref:type IV toxin-antitoxin system AbiEi family antitoxin domain-containing protein n=1 Tax=Aquipuribacter sp. SD81 TaxID=3127703 RepID=UPI003019D97E
MSPPTPSRGPDGTVADLAGRQGGVLTVAQLRAAGVGAAELRLRVRRGDYRRVRRGVLLVDRRLSPSDPHVAAAAVLLTVPDAVVAGASAARAWGLRCVPVRPLEVIVPSGRGLLARPDLVPHEWPLGEDEVTRWGHLPVTRPDRSVLDVVLTVDRLEALALLDEALRAGLLSVDEVRALRPRARRRNRSGHLADLFDLADPRAESALESRVRLRCVEGGLVPHALQLEVRDGAWLARVDLAFERPDGSLLLVEADGAAVHGSVEALHRDRARANHLLALGHSVLRFTWADTLDPATIPDAVRAALRPARRAG